jgi:hypothetical protein
VETSATVDAAVVAGSFLVVAASLVIDGAYPGKHWSARRYEEEVGTSKRERHVFLYPNH